MARKKKKGEEEHENAERWLLTYADMITLLMAFFIMMYSMSVMNMAKFREVAFSIRSGFGGMLQGAGKHLVENTSEKGGSYFKPKFSDSSLGAARQKMTSYVVTENLDANVTVQQDQRGLVISVMTDNLLFERGSAELTGQATSILGEIADVLRPMRNDVLVEGHTCTLPISSAVFPSNWELSDSRACRVVRYLQHNGIDSRRLVGVGYGESRPVMSNDTEEHRRHNRRVDIVILSSATSSMSQGALPTSLGAAEGKSENRSARPYIPKIWNRLEGGNSP